jgi:hypothetical protein
MIFEYIYIYEAIYLFMYVYTILQNLLCVCIKCDMRKNQILWYSEKSIFVHSVQNLQCTLYHVWYEWYSEKSNFVHSVRIQFTGIRYTNPSWNIYITSSSTQTMKHPSKKVKMK